MEVQVKATVIYIVILPTGSLVHASKGRKTGTVPWGGGETLYSVLIISQSQVKTRKTSTCVFLTALTSERNKLYNEIMQK
jgi:hypothetical protein